MAERQISFRDAVLEALAEEMRADPGAVLIGEDICAAGGVFLQTKGLFEEFGPRRVIDTPPSANSSLFLSRKDVANGCASPRRLSGRARVPGFNSVLNYPLSDACRKS